MNVAKLDGVKGALRLILTLAYNQVPLTRLEYMASAENAGVGRTAFYSGTRALVELGLVDETIEKREGKRVIYSRLTEDGWVVAKHIAAIEKLLSEGDSTR